MFLCRDIIFYVVTEYGKMRYFLSRESILDRVGQNMEKLCRDRAGHDGGALSLTTELGEHDKHACETGMREPQSCAHDRGILLRQTWTGLEVPMSRPDILGCD